MSLKNEFDQEKLLELFKTGISAKEMAKRIRRVNYVLSTVAMRKDLVESIRTDWIESGFYWLNELAETLDPMIDVD